MEVEDSHPLRLRMGVADIAPFLSSCFKKTRAGKLRASLKASILEEMEIEPPENEGALDEDPLMMLGYGVNAYLDLLSAVSQMFAVIFLFCLPVFYVYSQGGAFQDQAHPFVARFTLGNLGGASVACEQFLIESKQGTLQCPKGTGFLPSKSQFGLISNKQSVKTQCLQAAVDIEIKKENLSNCSKHLNHEFVNTQLQSCAGRDSCVINLAGMIVQALDKKDPECDENSYLFVQMPCLGPHQEASQKREAGLVVACIIVFIYFYSSVYLDYMKCIQNNKFVDFDVKTITAADYTVEFGVSPSAYTHFIEKYLDETNPISEINQFRYYLKNELEARLTAMPPLGFDGREGDEAPVKIAKLEFAFNNRPLIKWLKQRGTYIKEEKWAQVEAVNREINNSLKN